jgi:hypothetical protein
MLIWLNENMGKFIFLIWLALLNNAPMEPPKFEMRFCNHEGQCLLTISGSDLEKVSWSCQTYTLKEKINFENIDLYNGRIDFCFDNKVLLSVILIDFYSSNTYPKNVTFSYTNNGHLKLDHGNINLFTRERSESLLNFTSNKDVIKYFVQKHIYVE